MNSEPTGKHPTKAERKLEKKRLREEVLEKERRQIKLGSLATKLALLGLILAAGRSGGGSGKTACAGGDSC